MYEITYTKIAVKQIPNLKEVKLSTKVQKLIAVLKNNPFENPPPYERLSGDMKQSYSRRINAQHRLVYQVFEKEKAVKIISM